MVGLRRDPLVQNPHHLKYVYEVDCADDDVEDNVKFGSKLDVLAR